MSINNFIILMALIVLLGSAQGKTWAVTEGGSIQATIDSASPGDAIMVERGTYEKVNVTKTLTLRGDGYPVVDGAGNGSAVTLYADGILLEGFIATNYSKSAREFAGIKVLSNNNIIKNNNIYNGDAGTGILLNGSNDNTIAANNITDNEFGIYISSSNGNNITENIATKNDYGILLSNSRNNTVLGNNASFNTGKGIGLEGSTNNMLKRNSMSGNGYNFDVGGENDIDTSNLVDGKAVYYLFSTADITIDSSSSPAGIVCCLNSSNITIKDQNFDESGSGIQFYNTTDSRIENNTFKNMNGIEFFSSKNNTIMENNFSDGIEAIVLIEAYWNTIADNTIKNDKNGVRLQDSGYNEITRNRISNDGDYGIQLSRSRNNTVIDNNISLGSRNDGISLLDADWNTISGNSINVSFGFGNDGISLLDADRNRLSGNSIRGCFNGIHLEESYNNTLIENNATENIDHGIFITDNSEGNIIKTNNVYNNGKNGIFIDDSNINIISDNNADHNDWHGINIEKSDDNIIANNTIRDNRGSGVKILDGSSGNEIKANNASYNKHGFIIEDSIESIVTNNSASYNGEAGIKLGEGSSGNIISDNNASYNKHGFLIENSIENIVDNNSATNNDWGMILDNSKTMTISSNSLNDNRVNGLSLEDSNNNTLADNSASKNKGCGFTLLNSENNSLTNNGAYNNSGGIAFMGSSYNEISSNMASNNRIGIYLSESDKNELKDNYVVDNEVGLAINSSENNTMKYNLSGTVDYGMVINNDTIIDRNVWDEKVLPVDVEGYLQSYEEAVMVALPGTESTFVGTSGETEGSRETGKSKPTGHGVHGVPYVPPSDGAAIQPTTEEFQQLAEEAAGRIVWNPPQNMTKGEGYWIEVRIAAENTTKLVQDLVGKGEIQFREIDVAVGISYEVILNGDQFNISSITPDTQRLGEDPAEWLWYVTPLEEGDHTLILYVFVKVGDAERKEKLVWPVEVNVIEPPFHEKAKNIFIDRLEFIIGTLILGSGLMGWIISKIRSRKKPS